MSRGFVMGDHTFLPPYAHAPAARLKVPDRKPIGGAIPPDALVGCARAARRGGPADVLLCGAFCGHNEPTFSVFDIVIEGSDALELSWIAHDSGYERVLVRRFGAASDWRVIFDVAWCTPGIFLSNPTMESAAMHEPLRREDGRPQVCRVAIGCEYRFDCASQNEISWITMAVLAEGDEAPFGLVDSEI